jgi:hypothetical protein
MRNEGPGIIAAWAEQANTETRRAMCVRVWVVRFPSEAPGLTFEQRVELALIEAREILREACA